MFRPVLPKKFFDHASALVLVGSRQTCNPPPTGTDIDFLTLLNPDPRRRVLHTSHEVELGDILERDGWVRGGSGGQGQLDGFVSYKRDDWNIIVARTQDFYDRYLAATSVAKRLNLLKKEDRIALFQAVLYSNRDLSVSLA